MPKIEDRLIELLTHDRLRKIVDATVLKSRLVSMGYGVACGRCGGCGSYSYNQIHGDICYGCGGTGEVAPKLNRELLARVTADIATGKLEEYAAEMVAKADRARVAKRAVAELEAVEAKTAWRAYHYGGNKSTGLYSSLSFKIHDHMNAVIEHARALAYRSRNQRLPPQERDAATDELARTLPELKARIEAIDRLWVRVRDSGALDTCREAAAAAKATGLWIEEEKARKAACALAKSMVEQELAERGFTPLVDPNPPKPKAAPVKREWLDKPQPMG